MLQFGVFTHSNRIELGCRVPPMPDWLLSVVEAMKCRGVFGAADEPDCCTINLEESA